VMGANNKGHKARVRIANDVATIALKSRRRGSVRTEFEYVIPYSDAEEMLRTMCDGNVLDKVRHFVSHEGNNWHVDVYEGLLDGVVLAEIELGREPINLQGIRLVRVRYGPLVEAHQMERVLVDIDAYRSDCEWRGRLYVSPGRSTAGPSH